MDKLTRIDIGDRCVECNCDTSFGSGNFVNRIPAATDKFMGFMCLECQCSPCEKCGELTYEWYSQDFGFVCEDCWEGDDDE